MYRLNDAVANISCGVIDQVTGVFAKVITVGVYALVFESAGQFEIQSNWLWFSVCFIAVDFCYYWSHRLSHDINLFWTGHVVHHQSEEYNLSVALRQGAIQKVLMFWVYLPLAVIGFPPEWFLISIGFNLLYQFWIHTEAIGKMGFFELIFNTPSHHRVHHGRNPKYIDRNHAGVLIIWDKLFGTFQKEEEHPTYGITRPTNSFNPVWAHVQPFTRLYHDVASIPGFKDKLLYLIKPPGWYPASVGGPRVPDEITVEVKKFDVELSPSLNWYVLIQYMLAIGLTAGFLFGMDLYSGKEKVVFVAFILYYVLVLGVIFDKRPVALWLDLLRLLFVTGLAVFAWQSKGWMIPAIVMIAFAVLSAIWLLAIRKDLNGAKRD